MNILGFDSATNACSVALLTQDRMHQRFQIAPRKHAELILPMIYELLVEANLTLKDIHVIAFGKGPGSFMGVRIATGIAQGLAFGIGCPVIPVSNLQALAQAAYVRYGAQSVIAGWDARMNEIYWGGYRVDALGVMRDFLQERLSKPEEILIASEQNMIAVGNAWHVYADSLDQEMLKNFRKIDADLYPHAEIIVQLGHQFYHEQLFISPHEATPSYLRDQVTHE